MGLLYTIGHSTVTFDYFLELLQKYQVNFLADVRSVPYSEHAPQFNKETLSLNLESHEIRYYGMGRYFGARRPERDLYTQEGYLDFEKIRTQDPAFKKRVFSIIKGLQQGYNIALMCTEKDPFDCHRAILVGRAFELEGIHVQHIRHDNGGFLEEQEHLNDRLIEKYFPDYREPDLFSKKPKTRDEYLAEAYRKRNQDIGYRIDTEKRELE